MSKVLVIKTSMIQADKSVSNALNDLFVEEYKKHASGDEFIYLDLNELTQTHVVMTHENLGTYFANSAPLIEQLRDVNKVIMSVPMTNFNVNAVTKVYFDHINVANQTFSYKYSKKGEAMGLLDHLDVQILTTQGAPFGWYPWGNHTAYLEGQWGFFGANVNTPILVSGTKVGDNPSKPAREVAASEMKAIQKQAKLFALLPARANENLAKLKN